MIVHLVIYNLLLLLLSPLLVIALAVRCVRGQSRRGLAERLGFLPARKLPTGPRIWLHAVSVGETVAATPIWQALLAALPGRHLLHSTTTDTGQAQAHKTVGERGQIIYFPFDLLPCAWLALARARPELVVLVETELWPNFLAVARLRGCKVVLANGIISDRTMRSAARLRPLYRWMMANIDSFCMQSPQDADRAIQLGADPRRVQVIGNTKFDQAMTSVPLGEQVALRDALGLTRDEPILLAGSSHPGEEEVILRAFRQVKAADQRVRLIIAPRHIQRAQEIEELIGAHGFVAARRTKLAATPAPPDAVLILDTIGELARAYALSTVAIVCGSFVPIGGHNVLEPLALGKPTIFGPHMHKNRDISRLVQEAGVGFQVDGAEALAARCLEFLGDPSRCRQVTDAAAAVFQEQRGASRRCAAAAARVLGMAVSDGIREREAVGNEGR